MAPGGGGKRKRGDRNYSYDASHDNQRPSPHRPGNLSLAQQSPQQQQFSRDQYDQRGGRRRGSRGGRGGGSQRSPINSPNPTTQRRSSGGPSAVTPQPATPSPAAPTKPSVETTPVVTNQPAPTPKTVATQTIEHRLPGPYFYEYVTDAQREAWVESGRGEVVAIGRKACQEKDRTVLSLVFEDLLRAGLEGRIDGQEAGSIVREIVESVPNEDTVERGIRRFQPDKIFLDILSICAEAWNVNVALKPIVFSTNISAQLMRLILDSSLLESLGLIRSTFVRVGIRQQTNLLYRQSNYNLLREETEGYSKLVTELFTTSSGEALSSEVVEETFERVKGMIGAFDLDVGRVLDVTLDVFAALLVKQYRFFVKYLRVSSWWPQDKFAEDRAVHGLGTLPKWALPGAAGRPISDEERAAVSIARDERDKEFWQRAKEIGVKAFFEIGNRRPARPELQHALDIAATAETEEADEDLTWMDVTGTLPPVGNKIAAQILGFKLKFYSSSARDASDILPLNIIYLAALLIKVGFISLRDLYPHLWPSDDVMNDIKETKMKENAEKERLSRPGANMPNALLSSRALTDDRTPAQREAARKREEAAKLTTVKAEAELTVAGDSAPVEEKDELPEPAEQKVQLLKSLLCIGAIPESLYMLGRFPWLLEAFTELPEYLHRILHHSLNKVYEPLRPLKDHSDLREQSKILDGEQPASAKGQLRFLDAAPRKIMRWAQLDKDDTNEGIDYRFYWDDWADSIPVCQTVDDVFLLCSTLLNLSGVKIGQDASLLVKLCRIGRHSLDTDRSEANKTRWIDLSKRIILPALSLTKSNPGVANEVFDLIKGFSLHTRYSLYAEWFQGQTSRLPEIKGAIDRARLETTNVLKRISKSNIRTMARALAKISYSCPGAVFQFAISQIEFYENFAETFTECARYLTYLAYDVFNWALLSAVGGGGKSRVQADGMLTSHWLQSLTVFIGKVYKRYSVMSPVPMLQYVLDQLTHGNSVDLLVVEEMVTTMAGIVSDTNFNDAQVEAMAGGDLLQAQTMLQLLDRRHECRSTAKRLMRCLAEPKLAGQLLVAIAQERENSIYNLPDKDAPGKLLGNLFDEVHRVLTQYLDFMRSTLSITDFNALVPGVSSLIIDFGLVPAVAFWISRASITAAMSEYDASHPTNGAGRKQSPTKELLEAEALGAGSGNKEQNQNLQSQDQASVNTARVEGKEVTIGANSKPEQEKAEVEMKDVEQVDNAPVTSSPDANPAQAQPPWHPVLREIMDRLQPAAPASQWEYLSVSFYVTFWQLTLRDMQVPGKSYENEQGRLRNKLQSISSDRSDISVLGTQRKEREKKAIQELMDRLVAEHKERISGYSKTRSRLQKEKLSWFPDIGDRWDDFNTALIEQCFFPRIRISLVDALYAFKMFKYLHSSGTTNFRTLKFLDQLFVEKRLESLLYLCSAKEAEYLGRFLREMLKDLSRWHADKALFEKEAFGTKQDLKGFCIKTGPNKTSDVFMDYEDFRRILNKWHQNINNALKKCFSSGEYMHIRNAINVSNGIVETFPAVNWMGKQQAECIEHVMKTEAKRPDLHLAAASLLGHLRRREKEWVIPQAFSLSRNEHGANGASVARSGSAKSSTPQPASAERARSLNPNAPTFEPSPRTTTNGLSKPSRTGDPDAEDGEIEDAKVTDVVNASGSAKAAASEIANITKKPMPVTADAKAVHREASKALQGQTGRSTPDQVPPKATPMRQTPLQGPPSSQVNGPTSSSVTGQASVPSRPEVGINSPSPSANGRQQHSLPDRPEPTAVRSQPQRVLERAGDRHVRDDGGDVRIPNGLSDSPRTRMPNRELTGKHPRADDPPYDRHQPDNQDRSDQQLADKRPRLDYDDSRGGPSRQDFRPRSDVQQPYARGKQFAEQQSIYAPKASAVPPRDSMPPPRSNMPHHPDRAALIQGNRSGERPFSNSQYSDRRPEPSRQDEYPTSGRSSRGVSPARSEDRRPLRSENRRDVRSDDRPPAVDRRNFSDSSHSRQSRYEDGRPPAGPRTNHSGNFGQAGPSDRFLDPTKPPPAVRSAVDPNHGRLNQDLSFDTPQAEQYGRLNAGTEVPSGPRIPNGNASAGRNMRNVSAPQPQIDTRQPHNISSNAPPVSPIGDRQAPTGPSSNRGAPRGQGPPFNRQDASASSAPPTPAAESPDTVGIHPDRLKALQGISDNSASQNPDNMNPNSIQIHGRGPPTRQSAALQQPPPVTVPRGPSSQQPPPSPAGPSPTSRGPPTGPGRGDKRFAGIQGVLQQANAPNGADRGGQGTSIRGRGGRPNHVSSHAAATSGPPTPSMQRPDQLSQRQDLFAGRQSGPPTPQPHPADYEASYSRDARRSAPHDVGREDGREGGRDGRSVGREHMRDGARDSGRDAGRDTIVRDGDRRSTRHRTNHSQERDHGPPPPPSQRDEYDYERQPPRRDEGIREVRPRGGPLAAASSSSSRPIRSEVEPPSRERRGAPPPADYREQGEWGRSERDRRDGGGRKRGRPGDEGPQMGSGEKRARRGP